MHTFSLVQLLSRVWLCDPVDCSAPGFPVHHQLAELTQTLVHQVSDVTNCLILCHSLLFPPSIFPSTRVFSNESVLLIRWPKYWSFSLSISPLPLGWTGWNSLQSKGLFKSLLQHHSSKALILQCSAFFIVQLSHPHMTTGKTIAFF